MDIGHSRLLKFLLPTGSPNMSAKQELRVEYIGIPSKVESEVPEQQNLRQPPVNKEQVQNGDNSDDKDNGCTFVPVYKARKVEAVFTKGDLKLQKVSVTEDISKAGNNIVNPMYSEVYGEVIHDQRPLRTPPNETVEVDEEPDINKPKSKIPQLTHKMDKIRQDPDESKARKIVSRHPRRSSIPKLKKIETTSNQEAEDRQVTKIKNEQGQNFEEPAFKNEKHEVVPLEEDFDKIFDQIINNNNDELTDVLVDNYDDPEKLEHSFEEIVHDYEENKIQPIEIKQIKSKTPLIKQKSLPEVNFAKKLERRQSLKDIPIAKSDSKTKSKTIRNKLDDLKRKYRGNSSKEKDLNFMNSKSNDTWTEIGTTLKSDSNEVKNDLKSDNIVNETIEVVAPVISEANNDKKIIQSKNTDIQNHKSVVKANEKLEKVDHRKNNKTVEMDKNDDLKAQKSKLPLRRTMSSEKSTNNENVQDINNKTIISKLREPLSKDTTKSSNELTSSGKKDTFNEMPKKKSIISKITIFNKNKDLVKGKPSENLKPVIGNGTVSTTKTVDEILVTNDITNKNLNNFNNNLEPKTPPTTNPPIQEKDLNREIVSQNDLKRNSGEEVVPLILAAEIPRDPDEKLKLVKDKTVFSELPTSLNTKLKLKLNNTTPPNTPQVNENEPYRDSAHLAGEPKILNIDVEGGFEIDISKKPIHNNSFNQSDDIIDKQDIPSKKPHLRIKTKQSARDIYNQIEYDSSPSIDFHSPNPDEFDRAPLYEAVNKKLNTECSKVEIDENDVPVQGKVSKIIKRIDSVDERTGDTMENKITVEIPAVKSVSLKIAMFENQAAPSSAVKPKSKVLHDIKPKIIQEVLKTQPPRRTDLVIDSSIIDETHTSLSRKDNVEAIDNDNTIQFETIEQVAKVVEVQVLPYSVQEDIIFTTDNLDTKNKTLNLPNNEQEDSNEIKYKDYKNRDMITLPKREKEVVPTVKERLNKMKSMKEEDNLKKSKSLAELDLGDAVKGKVHQMIFRMKSVENILTEKKHDNINMRERPRKKSVSEKIALFENKLVVFEKVDKPPPPAFTLSTKPPATTNTMPPHTPPAAEPERSVLKKSLKNAKEKYGTMKDIMYMKLNNGQSMPVITLGTALMDKPFTPHIIGAAIDLGFRAIDTAYIYGNEKEVGEAIKAKIDDGTVQRKDLFIIGKLWSTFHRKDLVEQACLQSLNKLGIEYFDMYLIHNPMSFKEDSGALPKIANVLQYSEVTDYLQAWYGMEELLEKGLTKGIGVSNFNSTQVEKILEKGKVKPAVNQVECHPYLTQRRLDQFCAERNVSLMCFGTLGSKSTPDAHKDNKQSVIDDPAVKAMAAEMNISAAQLLIAYQIECGHSVVTASMLAEHLWEILQAQTVKLTEAQVEGLHALNCNKRTYSLIGLGETHPNYPFKITF